MVKLLIKNRIAALIGALSGKGRPEKKRSNASYIVMGILYVILIGCFAFLSTTMALTLGVVFIPNDATWLYFSIFMLASVSILFIFSIFETKSELFECKDNDLILSMPIKPRDIVLSRISVVLIYNYLVEAVVMLPAIIVYFIISHDFIAVLGSLIISLFLPLVSTALASGVGYIVAWISKRIKNNSFVILIISVAFLVAYFLGYGKLMEGMDSIFEAEGESLIISKEEVPLLYFIGKSVSFSPISFISVILFSSIVAIIAYLIISKCYFGIITKTVTSKRVVYNREKSKKIGVISALTIKELRRFTSSATYMLNAAIGLVFEIILGVVAIVKKSELELALSYLVSETLLKAEDIVAPLMISALVFLSSMTMISASALSLEGKNLWIPKTLPVSDKAVLISKTLPQIIIALPPTIITAVLLMIAVGAHIKYWAFFILTPVFVNLTFALFGSIINVLFPKFNYQNEAQVVKQSFAVFVVMMAQMLIGIAVFVFNLIFALMGLSMLAVIITLLVFIMLTVLLLLLLIGPCARKYSKIEV